MDASGTGLFRATITAAAVLIVMAVAGAAGLSVVTARLQGGPQLAQGRVLYDPEVTGAVPGLSAPIVLDPCTGQPRR